jgi:hypothetical protein
MDGLKTLYCLGLNELSLNPNFSATFAITNLGKRINQNLYLRYQQGILEEGYKPKTTCQITPSLAVIGECSVQSNFFELDGQNDSE